MSGKTILFFGEASTFAHVARPFCLASSLAGTNHDVYFASAKRFEILYRGSNLRRCLIDSVPAEVFMARVLSGRRLFTAAELITYAQDELKLFDRIRPDLVIGDFRQSLCISTQIAGVPYFSITNAYWSPYRKDPTLPLQEIHGIDAANIRIASWLMRALEPAMLRFHAKSLVEARRHFGLSPFANYLEGFTHGDRILFPDVPELVPTTGTPEKCRYLGAVTWSPEIPLPHWWGDLPPNRTTLYVSLGSSGPRGMLTTLLRALDSERFNVILTTGFEQLPSSTTLPANFHVAAFLPGHLAASIADLVICNGGSPTAYQALSCGTPVLGIATNIDQLLCMENITRMAAGLMLRRSKCTQQSLLRAVDQVLSDPQYQLAATRAQTHFRAYDATKNFQQMVEQFLHSTPQRTLAPA